MAMLDRPLGAAVLVLSAIMICALPEPRALGAPLAAAPPRFDSHYVFGRITGCRNSASAACRRKARARSPSALDRNAPNGASRTNPEFGAGSVRLQGDADAVRLEARDATLAGVLGAMAGAFAVHYRSAVALDEKIDGTYVGPLTRVMARVLVDYDYAIKHEHAALELTIFGKRGERAVPGAAPPVVVAPLRRGRCGCPVIWPPPYATRLSHQNRCRCGA
jgi:hypothetical protein